MKYDEYDECEKPDSEREMIKYQTDHWYKTKVQHWTRNSMNAYTGRFDSESFLYMFN